MEANRALTLQLSFSDNFSPHFWHRKHWRKLCFTPVCVKRVVSGTELEVWPVNAVFSVCLPPSRSPLNCGTEFPLLSHCEDARASADRQNTRLYFFRLEVFRPIFLGSVSTKRYHNSIWVVLLWKSILWRCRYDVRETIFFFFSLINLSIFFSLIFELDATDANFSPLLSAAL